jgi:NTE family protein
MTSMSGQTKFLNLVFQGGGVRGIAYAGVLASLPKDCEIHSVGGTSAGAVVAGLLAIGVRGDELKAILSDPALFKLLDETEVLRVERLTSAWIAAKTLWEESASNPGSWQIAKFSWRHRNLLADLRDIWRARGLHSSHKLREWLDRVLKGKTFNDIIVDDLRVVASDVSGRAYKTYDKQQNRSTFIAEAVHASASIPLFFSPLALGPIYLVDGGLLSNFPSFLFAQGKYPTIGFRLADIATSGPLSSTLSYMKALVATMAEAHDKHRADPPHFKAYWIDTPPEIPSTKFALTKDDVDELYDVGLALGRTVDWNAYSSTTPLISFYEPQPQEAFEFSLMQARELWDSYCADHEFWVDELRDTILFTVRVERDWSTSYERKSEIEVSGDKPLVMTVFKAVGIPSDSPAVLGFMDLPYFYEEITQPGSRQPARIPAYNDRTTKGFLIFFNPPVSSDQKRRTFRSGFSVDREFAKSVALGYSDEVGLIVPQIAKVHRIRLTFRLLVDFDLGKMEITPQFPATAKPPRTEADDQTGRSYRVYEYDFSETNVSGMNDLVLSIRRAAGRNRS